MRRRTGSDPAFVLGFGGGGVVEVFDGNAWVQVHDSNTSGATNTANNGSFVGPRWGQGSNKETDLNMEVAITALCCEALDRWRDRESARRDVTNAKGQEWD